MNDIVFSLDNCDCSPVGTLRSIYIDSFFLNQIDEAY